MGGRNETEHNGYTQPLLNGVEAAKPEETELAKRHLIAYTLSYVSFPYYQATTLTTK